jgi:hypothetical protein
LLQISILEFHYRPSAEVSSPISRDWGRENEVPEIAKTDRRMGLIWFEKWFPTFYKKDLRVPKPLVASRNYRVGKSKSSCHCLFDRRLRRKEL